MDLYDWPGMEYETVMIPQGGCGGGVLEGTDHCRAPMQLEVWKQ